PGFLWRPKCASDHRSVVGVPMRCNAAVLRSKAIIGACAIAVTGMMLAVGPASADPPSPGSHTVRAGAARFEVLTPSLIRLEYAQDGHFEDSATFNVIDRDLPTPNFRVSHVDGWLTITTDRLTLRYREGSGPFDASNTSVTVDVAGSQVTGHPSWSPAP